MWSYISLKENENFTLVGNKQLVTDYYSTWAKQFFWFQLTRTAVKRTNYKTKLKVKLNFIA